MLADGADDDGEPQRRHSLSLSVLEFASIDEADAAAYEDSDFGVHAGEDEQLAEARREQAERAQQREHDEADGDAVGGGAFRRRRAHGGLFLTSPWAAELESYRTPIAPQGFKAVPRTSEELQEQRTIFAMPKSKQLSADVLDLAGKHGTYDRLVSLMLIRDTFETFAVDINYADPSNGDTPLMRACSAGLLDIVQLLHECSFNWVVRYPLDVDKVDFLGTTALMKAAQQGHLILCKYLLEVLHVKLSLKDYDGWSALMFAASKGHFHIVEFLVESGADVLDSTAQGDTPLMLAANNGYLNVVRYLVEKTEAGELFDEARLAADRARAEEEEAQRLEEEAIAAEEAREAGEDDEDDDEAAARREALAEEKKIKELQLAAQQESDRLHGKPVMGLEQLNQRGQTALLGAAHYGQLYVVHYLVSKGASPDHRDLLGRCSRDIPLSLLAHNRFGTPVVQPQVLAAVEAGLADWERTKADRAAGVEAHLAGATRNVKRAAVERAVVRFKRAERYMIDADVAQRMGQFETAHLLFSYAFDETRGNRLLREEIEIRARAKVCVDALSGVLRNQRAFRVKSITAQLRAEAQRNFFLAERYLVEKSFAVALQCLGVCLQYEPDNAAYMAKVAQARQMQNAKREQQPALRRAATAAAAPGDEEEEPDEANAEEVDAARGDLAPDSAASAAATNRSAGPRRKKQPASSGAEGESEEGQSREAPRQCQMFGFSFF